MSESTYVLGIDTCGPTGSVALARLTGESVEILGQTELEGRSYSSTLLAAVAELLERNGVTLRELAGMVVVNGPVRLDVWTSGVMSYATPTWQT